MARLSGYISEIFSSFQGEGAFAGRRHVFVRLAGCNLRCVYCDTPGSLVRTRDCAVYDGDGDAKERLRNPLSAREVGERVRGYVERHPGVHAVAITGGEPLVQVDFLDRLLEEARLPVGVLLETNGVFPARLERLLPFLSFISMDVKLPSNSGERALWAEHEEFLEIGRQKQLYVKVPVDEATEQGEFREAVSLVRRVDRTIPFYLQPIFSGDSTMEISTRRLDSFYDLAAKELEEVRVLPQTHRLLGVR